ncbi:MAG: hypothetical protein E6Q98_23020 [Rhodospirillaceae bacterium]|nr:MAG: hypothetical protein E6Q98_23020 [Rhodospirillaceae bacterium]
MLEEIKETLRAQGVLAWVSNAFWEILAIFCISALPAASYLLGQGVPPTRLFSSTLWLVNVSIGVALSLTTSSIVSLIFLAIKLFGTAEKGSLKALSWDRLVDRFMGMAHAGYAMLILFALVLFGSSFDWGARFALLGWLACAFGVFAVFLFGTSKRNSESDAERLPIAERSRAVFLLFAMAVSWAHYLGPVGGILLRTVYLGGGSAVVFVTDGDIPRNAALILEASDGWFIREGGQCDKLVFIASGNMKQQTWLNKKAQPVCKLESNFVALPKQAGS